MNNARKFLALVLAIVLCASAMSGCSGSGSSSSSSSSSTASSSESSEASEASSEASESSESSSEESSEETSEESSESTDDVVVDEYTTESEQIYDEVLGEFYTLYAAAKEEENVSLRYAQMAIAEAKLMEAAVMIPTTSAGGSYEISRIAPFGENYALWGNDSGRRKKAVIVEGDPITNEDWQVMKAKWYELKGTGTFKEWEISYLEEQGYTLSDTYERSFVTLPHTWDALNTSRAADTAAILQCVDGLLEYDSEGVLQPSLATSYTVSDDGLTYTFTIREGVKWTDSQGREVADLVADDFVAGMQHAMDAQGGLEYLVEGVIKNASEYISGEITDFSQVGVSAPDDHTLVYTLEQPTSYFLTMLSYSIFAPMSRSYYESQGGKFGAEFDDTASDYLYGTDQDHICYCGPYLCTNATENNVVTFEVNPLYWDYDNVVITNLRWIYNDGSDATKAYTDFKNGDLSYVTLNASSLEVAKDDGWFDTYTHVTDNDAVAYMGFFNVNRAAYANANDASVAVSAKTDAQKELTKAAMLNVHFRHALSTSIDRANYNAQAVGDELKNASLINSYTPWNFVALEEDVTIDINGTSTTFPAGTYYGEIEQAQLTADGSPLVVYDPDADNGNGSGAGYDGWYHPDYAKEELAAAIEELAAEGYTVDASNPIIIDLPYPSNSTTYTNKANALKQSVEAVFDDGSVIVNLVECTSMDEWYYAGYYIDYGYEANYDIYDLSGWAPDYGDPSTYLDTFQPEYAGYMVMLCGMF